MNPSPFDIADVASDEDHAPTLGRRREKAVYHRTSPKVVNVPQGSAPAGWSLEASRRLPATARRNAVRF